jgi:hypothetical protein
MGFAACGLVPFNLNAPLSSVNVVENDRDMEEVARRARPNIVHSGSSVITSDEWRRARRDLLAARDARQAARRRPAPSATPVAGRGTSPSASPRSAIVVRRGPDDDGAIAGALELGQLIGEDDDEDDGQLDDDADRGFAELGDDDFDRVEAAVRATRSEEQERDEVQARADAPILPARSRAWKPEEDQRLIELLSGGGPRRAEDWRSLGAEFGRSGRAVRVRYERLTKAAEKADVLDPWIAGDDDEDWPDLGDGE